MSHTGSASVNRRSLVRATAATAIGNGVEWFEYGIYGYVAVTVSNVFFVEHDVLATFGVLAVSFLLRPMGGIFFGHLGDRIGRQKVLVITILTMAAATTCIGLLPTYASVGVLSPILLLACRLVQGFAAGGEYIGAMIFVSEHAEANRRGARVTWVEFGTLIGFQAGATVAAATSAVLGSAAMSDWGWRLPFLIAGPIGITGLLLRWRLEDTPVFKELVERNELARTPIREMLRYRKPLVISAALAILANGPFYIILTYTVTYLTATIGLTSRAAFLISLGTTVVLLILVTRVGALSDRIGRRPILLTACIGFIVLTYPLYLLISLGSVVPVALGFLTFTCLYSLVLGTLTPTLPALFPSHVRYSGVGIAYNVFTALFGGTAPFIATLLVNTTGQPVSPAYYVIFCGLVALIPIAIMPETARASLRGTELPGVSRPVAAEPRSK